LKCLSDITRDLSGTECRGVHYEVGCLYHPLARRSVLEKVIKPPLLTLVGSVDPIPKLILVRVEHNMEDT
jgi:hypothetical protein